MSLDGFVDRFRKLNVNRANGISPHKPCMLLTVIDLIESGAITENVIRFDDRLLMRYAEYFSVVRTERDHPNPWMPFFHLKKDGFWELVPLPGREAVLAAMTISVRKGDITENVDYVRLDDELFRRLQDAGEREQLREVLMLHWFPERIDELAALFTVAEFEQLLKAGQGDEFEQEVPARSAAFRRLVLEAYDFRCAASGWRLVLPSGPVLVEAAHLVPFSVSRDDRPQNGIALAPTYHWAMDKNVIAPGPDGKWHVTKSLDDRIPDHRPFCDLDGRDVLLPTNALYLPDEEALGWRLAALE